LEVRSIQLSEWKIAFAAIGLIGILLFASPTLAIFVKPQLSQQFTQLYVLGPDQTLDNIPFNTLEGSRYLIYLGVGNELGFSSYYTIYVKIAAQNESFPNLSLGLPSTLVPLYEKRIYLQNEATWKAPFTFQINNFTSNNGKSLLSSINLNGVNYIISKSSDWDWERSGYYYNFIVELWIYNSTIGQSQYHNRFVSLRLNMTSS
jgi:uncharacterized membrane protein